MSVKVGECRCKRGRGWRARRGISSGSFLLIVLAAATVWPLAPSRAQDSASAAAAWRALAGDGAVALVRHAKAPGPSPDPPGARLEDCATQRNLSPEGRAQAARLGALWREKRVKAGKVLSSPWCRCIDTARLMGLGEPAIDHALYNLLANPPDRGAKIAQLQDMLRGWQGPGTLVLVTHGITMRAAVGIDPGEGGIVVVVPNPAARPGYLVVGTIPPPA